MTEYSVILQCHTVANGWFVSWIVTVLDLSNNIRYCWMVINYRRHTKIEYICTSICLSWMVQILRRTIQISVFKGVLGVEPLVSIFPPPAIECGWLSSPTNGHVRVSSATYGSVAMYGCDDHYLLYGDQYRQCQADGLWSGARPDCISE